MDNLVIFLKILGSLLEYFDLEMYEILINSLCVKATRCDFDGDPLLQKTKLNDVRYYVAQNSNFYETRSYFIERASSSTY